MSRRLSVGCTGGALRSNAIKLCFSDFIRLKLPYKTIKNVYDGNFDQFLKSWTDNKVRALILEPRNTPRLRYLLTAYHFQDIVEFG